MKKIFLSLAIILGTYVGVLAQEAGQKWIGGTASIWSSKKTEYTNQLNIKFIPEFGYNFTDKMAAGISLGISHTGKYKQGKYESPATNTYAISPFLRYTALKRDQGSLFIDGGVSYSWYKISGENLKSNSLEIGLRPGFAFNVSNKVSLISKFGFLGYDNQKITSGKGEYKQRTNSDTFSFNLNLNNIQFGAIVKF